MLFSDVTFLTLIIYTAVIGVSKYSVVRTPFVCCQQKTCLQRTSGPSATCLETTLNIYIYICGHRRKRSTFVAVQTLYQSIDIYNTSVYYLLLVLSQLVLLHVKLERLVAHCDWM